MDNRPLPFQSRSDLLRQIVRYNDEWITVIKDPLRLKYFRLQSEQAYLLGLLAEPHSIEDVHKKMQAEFPSLHVNTHEIYALLNDLHKKGLLLCERVGQSLRVRHRHWNERITKFFSAVQNPLFIRLPGWDVDFLLTKLNSVFGWLFTPAAILGLVTWLLFCAVFAGFRWREITQRIPAFHEFFGPSNLVFLWVVFGITKIVHELGHGIACKHFGGECRDIGVVLMVFSPSMYCDTSDSWMFTNSRQRLIVALAGIYFELAFASLAMIVWWHSAPGLIQNLCLNMFWLTSVTTLLFNANPLMRYDGYYAMCDLLQVSNLQQKAQYCWESWMAKAAFGIELPKTSMAPRSATWFYIDYAVAAAIYRISILIGIAFFMYSILKPYQLQMLGPLFALQSVGTMMVVAAMRWNRILKTNTQKPVSLVKIAILLFLLGIGVLALATVPIPVYLDAPCYLQLAGSTAVRTDIPGRVIETHVAPMDYVEAGQILVRLENPELSDRLNLLLPQIREAEVEMQSARHRNSEVDFTKAEYRRLTLQKEFDEISNAIEKQVVRAPRPGFVFGPPRILESNQRNVGQALRQWSGVPIASRNLGAFLERKTHLCTIADQQSFEAIIFIDQSDVRYLLGNTSIRIKMEQCSDTVLSGFIRDSSKKTTDSCPPALSVKHGGTIETITSLDGREVPIRETIEARADLENSNFDLLLEGKGTARIVVASHSALGWFHRWLVTEFRFRLI